MKTIIAELLLIAITVLVIGIYHEWVIGYAITLIAWIDQEFTKLIYSVT